MGRYGDGKEGLCGVYSRKKKVSPRLLILIAAAAGMAIFLAMRPASPAPDVVAAKEPTFLPAEEGQSLEQIRGLQKMLSERELPGEDPVIPAEFDVQVEVDPSGEKNRLYYYINELHGYYVETVRLELWYVETPDTTRDESQLVVPAVINDYIKANETYKGCLEAVPAELNDLAGHPGIGTDENWRGRVISYDRARETNPDPLPLVVRMSTCD